MEEYGLRQTVFIKHRVLHIRWKDGDMRFPVASLIRIRYKIGSLRVKVAAFLERSAKGDFSECKNDIK